MRKSWILWGSIGTLILVGTWFLVRPHETEDIKIGALLPLTGKLASYGEDIKNGLTLAQKELAQSGGVSFDIIFEDSAADPKTALSGARKLIDVDRMPLVIGAPGSSANLAVAPAFEEKRVLFFPISSTPKLNSAGDFIFKVDPDIEFEVARMVAHIRGQGLKKVTVLFDSANDTTTVGANAFRDEFNQGGEAARTEGFDSKTTNDFRTVLTTLKKDAPNALYIIANEKSSGIIVRQARALGLTQPIFGWSSFNGSEFFAGAGAAAEGVVITDMPFSCDGEQVVRDYCERYKAAFNGRQPQHYGANAYQLLQIAGTVLKEHKARAMGSEEVALIQKAFTNHTYTGVGGEMIFDENGNVRDKAFVFRVAEDGKFVDLK